MKAAASQHTATSFLLSTPLNGFLSSQPQLTGMWHLPRWLYCQINFSLTTYITVFLLVHVHIDKSHLLQNFFIYPPTAE